MTSLAAVLPWWVVGLDYILGAIMWTLIIVVAASMTVAVGVGVIIWSIWDTRRRYYRDFVAKRD